MTKESEEIKSLQREKQINDAQTRLIELIIKAAGSSKREQIVSITMQKVLDTISSLSSAEKGSIFLLDKDGAVTHYILTQDDLSSEKKNDLIGKVLDKGLAGWVKTNLKAGLIRDTKTDNRWITLKSQPYQVRSALSVPIMRHHYLFGIITLIHSRPFHFDRDIVNVIQHAADHLAIILENAMLYRKLDNAVKSIKKYSKKLDFELEQGRKIQRDFLPARTPKIKGYDIASCFYPALRLSGDFYDMLQLPGNRMGLVIGDVSGKGVGSALFMALTRSLLRVFSGAAGPGREPAGLCREEITLDRILDAVEMTNDYLADEHGEDGMFVTLFFGVVDIASGRVSYISGGHEPVMIVNASGIKDMLPATGPALGVIPEADYEARSFQLEKGDMLIGYTDGVTEARSKGREFYTRSRLIDLLGYGFSGSAEACLERIMDDLFEFTANAPQSDDITLLAFGRKADVAQ